MPLDPIRCPEAVRAAYNQQRLAVREYREAMSYYRQAIQLDSRHARAHHNLGVNLARLGQLKEAETLLRRATELDATYELAKRNLQRILEARRERNSQDQ